MSNGQQQNQPLDEKVLKRKPEQTVKKLVEKFKQADISKDILSSEATSEIVKEGKCINFIILGQCCSENNAKIHKSFKTAKKKSLSMLFFPHKCRIKIIIFKGGSP
jgi:3-deoxy-D-arabino-heptulosonate 7-phosphate (DAHP) synthase